MKFRFVNLIESSEKQATEYTTFTQAVNAMYNFIKSFKPSMRAFDMFWLECDSGEVLRFDSAWDIALVVAIADTKGNIKMHLDGKEGDALKTEMSKYNF